MANEKKDKSVLSHIDQLVKEEERLYAKGQLDVGDQKRLAELKEELDQYLDLLRQRRALEEFGDNPDKAIERLARATLRLDFRGARKRQTSESHSYARIWRSRSVAV
jgi:flagellar biosynthesis/type III secretory pathway chaperone